MLVQLSRVSFLELLLLVLVEEKVLLQIQVLVQQLELRRFREGDRDRDSLLHGEREQRSPGRSRFGSVRTEIERAWPKTRKRGRQWQRSRLCSTLKRLTQQRHLT